MDRSTTQFRHHLGNRARLVATLFIVCGCSTWKDVPSEAFDLPATRMSPDSVTLDITFVRVPLGQQDINSKLWEQIDEQQLTFEQRLHLNNNGFRYGLIGTQIPTLLRELLDQQQTTKLDQLVNSELDVLAQNRHVQCRSGKRTEVVTSAPRPEMVVLHKDADERKVIGKSFQDAQCILAVRTFPLGDGSVRVELTPEVHHGAPRKQWVAGEGTFHLLSGRERKVFQDLLMNLTLGAGQTLVFSCTPDRKGLGQNFFVEADRGDPQQKLLLLRLSQTQRDDLFDAELASSAAGNEQVD